MAFPCPPRGIPAACDNPSCTTDPPTPPDFDCPVGCELGPCSPEERADLSRAARLQATNESYQPRSHPCNCDEINFQASHPGRFPASYTKGLPHNALGEVLTAPYCELLNAIATANPNLFEGVDLGCCPDCMPTIPSGVPPALECRVRRRPLENPQAAYAFDLEGFDSHALCLPPAPRFSSAEEISEIAELYWMALARDVAFTQYAASPLITQARTDLAGYACIFAPTANNDVLFRGLTPGSQVGPYISQFLYMDTPYGAQAIPGRIRTLQPHVDYLTAYREWLAVQDGCDREQSACDDVFRWIRNGRDLAQFVHVDLTFNAFLNAALQLLSPDQPLRRCEAAPGRAVEFARCLPYVNPAAPFEQQFPGKSATQIGFATFGAPHLISLLVETMDRALKAVWYQKWSVHRRLRPEEFGGRIHNHKTGATVYPFHAGNYARLDANVLVPRIFPHNQLQNANLRRFPEGGTYLLPQAFAEGSPTHPSYGSGHSTVAGALGTILKAFFPGEHLILNPVVPTDDGTALTAFDPGGDTALTVEGEINKLVDNVGIGRLFAGVHWRSDHTESIRLGEAVALSILCNQRNLYNEEYEMRIRRYDGTWVRVRPGGICPETLEGEPGSCLRTRTPFLCTGVEGGGEPEL
ncbi:MAG TPA: vanadium-dependent haloperoxidase [Longimicrobium sp.]|nr:vanadium-dependent haloperoxidase [Longimicrobium sp.]